MSLPTADATPKPPGIVATIPLPPHRAITANQATVSSPGPAPEPSLRMSVPAIEPPADTATPLALAAIPDAVAKADALPPDRAAADAAKPTDKPRGAVVKKNVARGDGTIFWHVDRPDFTPAAPSGR
jgi:hypothetical protein